MNFFCLAAPSFERVRRTLLAAGVLLLSACAALQSPSDPLADLLHLIDQRLAIGEAVARNKWNSGAPIEDPARERAIIDAIGTQAAAHYLEPAFAKDFFRAQIEASKIVQGARFAQWAAAAQPPFDDPPDLQRDIRPQLDRLTMAMLAALAQAMPALGTSGANARLAAHASDAAHAAALAPLKKTALQD